jgi:5S rRNA maturation endonuclease (ribonuclease M5)
MKVDTQDIKIVAGIIPYESRLDIEEKDDGFWAQCPFHDDDHPSLHIQTDDGEGSYFHKCFGCDAGGDVIDFVQKFDKVEFKEAVARIQKECDGEDGVKVESPKTTAPTPTQRPTFVYDMKAATEMLKRNTAAQAFLSGRGIPIAFAVENNLGYVKHPLLDDAIAIPYGETGAVKFRALNPADKQHKWAQMTGQPTHNLLYGINDLDPFEPTVVVSESELDCLTLRASGFNSVSVSSATACMKTNNEELNIKPDQIDKLIADDHKVVIATDMDVAGRKCERGFAKVVPSHQFFSVEWPYKTKDDPKDLGEIYAQTQERFKEHFAGLLSKAINRPPMWRLAFRTVGEMESGGIRMLIESFLPEGVIFIGALSGHGKTWLVFSIIKALTTGKPLFGKFKVLEQHPIIYLTPEVGDRALRGRAEKFGIPDDPTKFLARTITQGKMLRLTDPLLLDAVRHMKPIVILDTAVRFSEAENESDAMDNQVLFNNVADLRAAGAVAVIALHHSPKFSANETQMTLENMLRGTGDFGAMADAVYGLKRDEALYDNGAGPNQMRLECIKPKDFDPPLPMLVALTYQPEDAKPGERPISFLDTRGDIALIDPQAHQTDLINRFTQLVTADPSITMADLLKPLGLKSNYKAAELAKHAGYKKTKRGPWVKAESQPATEPEVVEF